MGNRKSPRRGRKTQHHRYHATATAAGQDAVDHPDERATEERFITSPTSYATDADAGGGWRPFCFLVRASCVLCIVYVSLSIQRTNANSWCTAQVSAPFTFQFRSCGVGVGVIYHLNVDVSISRSGILFSPSLTHDGRKKASECGGDWQMTARKTSKWLSAKYK